MKKTTKRVLIALVFLAGLAYFTFTLVFFDPFEDSYLDSFDGPAPVRIEYVIPRTIDWFAHKRELEGDFDAENFPVPRDWSSIVNTPRWTQFSETPVYQAFVKAQDPGAKVQQIRESLAKVPLLDPLSDVLGREVAVFGRLKERKVYDHDETACAFLGTRWVKFGFEAAANGVVRGMLGIPYPIETDDNGVMSVKIDDANTLYLWRHLDLFVVSTGPGLVKEVRELIEAGREQSLGFALRYHATVAEDVENFAGMRQKEVDVESLKRRVQTHVKLDSLWGMTDFDESFVEHRGEVSRWLLARLFNPRYFDDLTLDVAFGRTLDVRGMLGFDKDRARQNEAGFYDRKTFDLRAAMDSAATVLPEDTFFVAAARVDMRQFLPLIVKGLGEVDPAAKELIDGVIQAVRKARPDFRAGDATEAAKELSNFLGQDVVFAMKRDNYLGDPKDPMPLVALLFQVVDKGPELSQLEQQASIDPTRSGGYNGFIYPIMKAHSQLKSGGEHGVKKWVKVTHFSKAEPKQRSVQDVFLIGTGIKNVAFGIIDPRSKTQGPWTLALVLSPRAEDRPDPDDATKTVDAGTAQEMINDFVQLSESGGAPVAVKSVTGDVRQVRSLHESKAYQDGRDFLEGFASVATFLEAGGLKRVLIDQTEAWADEATAIDWEAAGHEIEQRLYAGEFASWRGKAMPKNVKDQFDAKIDAEKKEMDRVRRAEKVPAKQRELKDSLAWVDLLQDAFLAARIDESSQNIELRAKIRTHLGE